MLKVEELIDREEIRSIILRYFRAADRVDAELGTPTFWEDGQFIGGPLPGPMKDVLPALYGELLPNAFELTLHYIQNLTVKVDGDRGYAEAYAIGYQLVKGEEAIVGAVGAEAYARFGEGSDRVEFLAGVRYAIELERRGKEWRMSTMAPIIDWTRVQPYQGIVGDAGLLGAITNRGTRDRSDQSYFGRDLAF